MQSGGREGAVGDVAHRIGDENFLGHANGEEGDAPGEFIHRMGAMAHLLLDGGIADDGPGHQVGEEGLEAAEIDEVAHRPGFAAIDIDGIAHRLEGVEGDTDGEDHAESGDDVVVHSQHVDQGFDVFDAEADVLEIRQQQHVGEDGNPQGQLHAAGAGAVFGNDRIVAVGFARQTGLTRQDEAADIVHAGAEEHEHGPPGIGPAVEGIGAQGQQAGPRLEGQKVIEEQDSGKEVEDEQVGREHHIGPASFR